MKKFCVALLVLVLVGASAQAAMVVVAAEPGAAGNTVRSSDFGTDWMGAGETATTYRNRSLAEVGGDGWCGISGVLPYSAYANSADSLAPELLTTVDGFGAFENVPVWVMFSTCYNNDGSLRKNDWVDAGTASGSLTAYSIGAGNTVRTGWVSRVESSLYYEVVGGEMGLVQADGDGIITLYADSRVVSPIDGVSSGDRSIFHGYAFYEIPEPATMALLGFGGLALLRKRK